MSLSGSQKTGPSAYGVPLLVRPFLVGVGLLIAVVQAVSIAEVTWVSIPIEVRIIRLVDEAIALAALESEAVALARMANEVIQLLEFEAEFLLVPKG